MTPEANINFKIDYGISKKGNRTITVSQIPTEKYPFERSQGFRCSQKYGEIIKIRTVSDREFFGQYIDKTVEDVFKIAFELQEWRLIPFDPITRRIEVEWTIPEWVHFKGDEND